MNNPFSGGEEAFVRRLARRFAGPPRPRGSLGIGDDAAVLPAGPRRVVTTDMLVEGQHFRFDLLSPTDLAVRALEANLSDIAAMGARPEAAFLGLAWPAGGRNASRAGQFLAGLRQACRGRRVPLLGGDTVRSPGPAMIALTLTGIPWPGGPVLRGGGRSGDLLVVTGPLGGSALGLAILAARVGVPRDPASRRAAAAAIAAFRRPRARLDAARAMARHADALIDISDGLGLDLTRLARAGRCGFEVDNTRIPLHRGLRQLLPEGEAIDLAISGGEDYELLAAVPACRLAALRRALAPAGRSAAVIGRLLPRSCGERAWDGSRWHSWKPAGWDPFADRPPNGPPRGRLDASGSRPVGERGRRRSVAG